VVRGTRKGFKSIISNKIHQKWDSLFWFCTLCFKNNICVFLCGWGVNKIWEIGCILGIGTLLGFTIRLMRWPLLIKKNHSCMVIAILIPTHA
jgi:hypothetical protein